MQEKLGTVVLGGGCFWCLDAAYRQIKGVVSVTSGYAGGDLSNPSYEQVSSGAGGHAEVVRIEYNPRVVEMDDILDVFWTIHDPTTLNRQGNDNGPQYRSIMLYRDDIQKRLFEKSKQSAQRAWGNKIITEIVPLQTFYPAEDYHQDFFTKNPSQAYCQIIINPKLHKLREKFAKLLK